VLYILHAHPVSMISELNKVYTIGMLVDGDLLIDDEVGIQLSLPIQLQNP